ncbi:hypothetical protein ACFQAS_04825 [Halopenitus salinus]|uniref:4-vinyl reductase 4VR domain-containing protein n=1 Tax=Halopenitus salinus TaxID=1198295 RepID=A0ABD5USB6_9EURY
MTPYEAFDDETEVRGQVVRTIVTEAMGKFSDEYRDRAMDALADEGIVDPGPDEWYPQQAWLNAFEVISDDLETHVLDRLGQQIPSVADWPTDPETVPEGLKSIDDAYQQNHRNGGIGYYRFKQTGDQVGTVTCRNPYPCPFDRGLIRGAAQEYAPVDSFVFVEETGTECRRNGGDECEFTVYW